MTATNQTDFHKYIFPASKDAPLWVDIKSSFAGTIAASRQRLNDQGFTVKVSAKNVCLARRYMFITMCGATKV